MYAASAPNGRLDALCKWMRGSVWQIKWSERAMLLARGICLRKIQCNRYFVMTVSLPVCLMLLRWLDLLTFCNWINEWIDKKKQPSHWFIVWFLANTLRVVGSVPVIDCCLRQTTYLFKFDSICCFHCRCKQFNPSLYCDYEKCALSIVVRPRSMCGQRCVAWWYGDVTLHGKIRVLQPIDSNLTPLPYILNYIKLAYIGLDWTSICCPLCTKSVICFMCKAD
jgi:hypothetical protein